MSAAFHIGSSERETVLPRLWHFLTEVLGLEKERLWVTYLDDPEFGRDEASYRCWRALGVDEARLVGLDQQHCFWRQRSLGQIASDGKKCGPHTEVFYERIEVACPACENREQPVGSCRCGRFVEISNSLFIENYVSDDGGLIAADTVFAECVVGLERLAMILQGVESVYHTRRFEALREALAPLISRSTSLEQETSINIILDHLSAFVKLVSDGAPAPGRGGRAAIMRKLARGAVTHAILAGIPSHSWIHAFCPEQPEALRQFVTEEKTFMLTLKKAHRILELHFKEYPLATDIAENQAAFFQKKYGIPLLLIQHYIRMGRQNNYSPLPLLTKITVGTAL